MSESSSSETEHERDLTALLLDVVHERQRNGEVTRLRDLHDLIDAPQPLALRIARNLESEDTLIIAPDLSDAFASQVTLSPNAERRLAAKLRPWNPFAK